MSKQRNALQMALKALERGRPQIVGVLVQQDQDEAIKAIREALAELKQEQEFWPGDVLICKEDDTKVTVVNGNRGSMQLMNGKISIAWSDTVGGEYTIEQIKEMFYRTEDPEPARKPLTVEEIHLTISMIDRGEQRWLTKFARAIEQAHGIGGE